MSIETLTSEEKSKYIIVVRPDSKLLVAKNRLSYEDKEVKKASEKLGLNLGNTAQEKSGHSYIGNITHNQALKLILTLKDHPLKISEFVAFYNLLRKGLEGKKVYDGNGKNLDTKEISYLFDEIAGKRDPYRGEYLADSFHKLGDLLYIASDYEIVNGKLKPKKIEPLEGCLMEDGYVDLSKVNNQGLPIIKSKKKEVYFLPPRGNGVARFDAVADVADLDCYWVPLGSDADLGVRRAKIFSI